MFDKILIGFTLKSLVECISFFDFQGGFAIMKEHEEIVIEWQVEEIEDDSRVTSMYCFKSCSVNQN